MILLKAPSRGETGEVKRFALVGHRLSMILKMRADQEKYSEVELSTEEFFNIYDGVRETLLSEIGPRSDAVEGKTLVDLCEDALNPKANPPKYFDFHFGFIPLYEALHEAKREGQADSTDGSVYKVRF